MSRPKPIALAVVSALAVAAVATPALAQSPRDLTAQERAARGLDIVRYCAPQIAALGRLNTKGRMQDVKRVSEFLRLDQPQWTAMLFFSGVELLNADTVWTPEGRADHEVELCMSGRAIALDAERFDALGLITFKNNSPVDLRVMTPSADMECTVRKNGGSCTRMLTPGNHRFKAYSPDGRSLNLGEASIAAGAPVYTEITD